MNTTTFALLTLEKDGRKLKVMVNEDWIVDHNPGEKSIKVILETPEATMHYAKDFGGRLENGIAVLNYEDIKTTNLEEKLSANKEKLERYKRGEDISVEPVMEEYKEKPNEKKRNYLTIVR